jgi:hypothetical protein
MVPERLGDGAIVVIAIDFFVVGAGQPMSRSFATPRLAA